MKEFQMTYASIIGAVHEKLNYNNQDAVLVHRDKDLIIGLLSNGCGSGKYTEVGARLITNYIKNYLLSHDLTQKHWQTAFKENILSFLKNLIINQKEEEMIEFIKNYLLVGFQGFVMTSKTTTLFSCGDAVNLINDKLTLLKGVKRSKFIVRELLIDDKVSIDWREVETQSIERLVIATNGIIYLLDNAPSLEDIISEFVHHKTFYKSSVALQKFLQTEQQKGILRDDTSIIMLINK